MQVFRENSDTYNIGFMLILSEPKRSHSKDITLTVKSLYVTSCPTSLVAHFLSCQHSSCKRGQLSNREAYKFIKIF